MKSALWAVVGVSVCIAAGPLFGAEESRAVSNAPAVTVAPPPYAFDKPFTAPPTRHAATNALVAIDPNEPLTNQLKTAEARLPSWTRTSPP